MASWKPPKRSEHHWVCCDWSIYVGVRASPRLTKVYLKQINCVYLTAGLQDWKDWRTGSWGSNTPVDLSNYRNNDNMVALKKKKKEGENKKNAKKTKKEKKKTKKQEERRKRKE